MDKSLLDKTWNDAIEEAAVDCEQEAKGYRAAASGSNDADPHWKYSDILMHEASCIRKLKR